MFNKLSQEELEAAKKQRLQKLSEFREGLEESRRQYFDAIPDTYKWSFFLAHGKTTGTKLQIKLKCLDCSCWSVDDVRKCTVINCALYNIRPFK